MAEPTAIKEATALKGKEAAGPREQVFGTGMIGECFNPRRNGQRKEYKSNTVGCSGFQLVFQEVTTVGNVLEGSRMCNDHAQV